MHYNIYTSDITTKLPAPLHYEGRIITRPNEADYHIAGWRPCVPFATPEGYVRTGIRRVEIIEGEWRELYDIEPANAAQERAAVEREKEVVKLTGTYGKAVMALQMYLDMVGWSIPCDAAAVTEDLITRSVQKTLTPEQEHAKGEIADIYTMLSLQNVSNDDIADIKAFMESLA
jgi:hypothetical protein